MASAPRTPRRRPRRVVVRRPRTAVGPGIVVVVALLLLVLPLLGVGRERTKPTEIVRPSPPSGGFTTQNVGLGTLVRLPQDPWSVRGCDDRGSPQADQPNLRCVVTSGPGVLSIWIYPRGQRGPHTKAQLAAARVALVAASKARDRSFHVVAQAVTRYDGLPAIQLRGTARILGLRRTIRSTHVFVGGREIVIDAYAPSSTFRGVDAAVFRPVLRSLVIAPDWRRVRAQDGVPTTAG